MKHSLQLLSVVLLATLTLGIDVAAQVLNPDDPIVEYDPDNPRSRPAWGQVGKWVRTERFNWDSDDYKAYIYKSINFRLMFPNDYDASSDKKYPLILMFHGKGEAGGVTDNEKQLVHGGRQHRDAVKRGNFNGFVLYPQSFGSWSPDEQQEVRELLDYMIGNANVDPFRINVHGLSNGGKATWAFFIDNPTLVASALPMSATTGDRSSTTVDKIKYTPIWNSQGGLDKNPTPSGSKGFVDIIENAGGNVRYTLYPNLGHGVWNTHYAESDFFPFMARANKVNPWPLFERKEFCPSDPIRLTLGLTPGFEAYEWRKDGNVISGANAHELAVTSVGTYDARVKRNGVWSYWSPAPVEVKVKDATQTPPIQLADLHSSVIPSPDGRNYTVLELPEGFEAYEWKKVGSGTVLSSESTFKATSPGEYVATVTEKFGCSSNPSAPFKVVDAGGANSPDPASGVSALVRSKTEIRVAWSDNPSAANDETGFEVYRSTTSGGPYELVHTGEANVLSYTDANLSSGKRYYYVVRAVNRNGASTVSDEASATTNSDTNPPTAPANLTVVSNTTTSVTLDWREASDDVGIENYTVYRNGTKSVVTDATTTTIYNLSPEQVYNFTVKAADPAGNLSPASNQVTVKTVPNGLTYSYYEGSWTNLPNFNNLTPVKTGQTENVTLDPRERNDNFALKFEGTITIPTDGEYTFYTASDDGSKLYIGGFNQSNQLVNNDGRHGKQEKSGTTTLQAGTYPFFVTFFQGGGGRALEIKWQGPGISKQLIPSAAFQGEGELSGDPPVAPSQLVANAASYNRIALSWSDNSDNEQGFQIYRATSANGTFQPIILTDANQVSYEDENVAPETTYYYRVLAVGQYGESDFTNDADATTPSSPSAPTAPSNLTATPTSASRIALRWQDESDNETGFEVYRSVGSNGNYLPLVELDAQATDYVDQDLFTNTTYFYQVRALGSVENSAFSAEVSTQTIAGGNHDPAIEAISDVTVQELSTSTVSVSASDTDGDPITLAGQNFPNFASLSDNGDGTATITLSPQVSDRGSYTLTVAANDNQGGASTTTFEVTVGSLQSTFSISVNFHKDGSTAESAPWNNISSFAEGSSITNMVDADNKSTNVSMTLLDAWAGNGSSGVSSGLYPSNVNKSYFYTWKESSRDINISGLNSSYKYSFTFFASRANKTDNRKTSYKIGESTVILDPIDNSNNTVKIQNVSPDANGEVIITVDKAAGSRNAYINALVIEGNFDDGTQPAAPSELTASLAGSTSVALRWKDNSFNETGFEVHRSDDDGATFSLVATTGSDVTSYNDGGLSSSVAYQYKVRATNANGNSGHTNVATATTNDLPATPSGLVGKTVSQNQVQLSWVDNATNESGYKVYRSASSAGTYTEVGTTGANSTSFSDKSLSANRVYYYQVSATNAEGESVLAGPVAVATRSFSVYVNFSIPDEPAPAPWNNTGNEPVVGNTYSNLTNQGGNNTGIDMSVAENSGGTTFAAAGYKGVVTGDNSGIYPDAVIKSYWWIEQVEVATLKFDDLDLAMQYDFVFFGSRAASSRGTDFTINGTTVTLDVANNTSETVEINGVSPDNNGRIVIDMKSMAGARLGYVGAIVVHASPSTGSASTRTLVAKRKKSDDSELEAPPSTLGHVSAYPNPFSDQLFVNFDTDDNASGSYQVSLYDLTGSVVYTEALPYDSALRGVSIDVSRSQLGAGNYILRIASPRGPSKSVRLIKY